MVEPVQKLHVQVLKEICMLFFFLAPRGQALYNNTALRIIKSIIMKDYYLTTINQISLEKRERKRWRENEQERKEKESEKKKREGDGQLRTCSMHQTYSSSVSPFHAYTGTPVLAIAAAAKSCVEKMLQLDHWTWR